MNQLRKQVQNQLVELEFIIMTGVLLLVVTMCLLAISNTYEVKENSQERMKASVALQNMMEYCKVNAADLKERLVEIGGTVSEEEENGLQITLYYDENWKQVIPITQAKYSIEIGIDLAVYTYGTLQKVNLEAYNIGYSDIEESDNREENIQEDRSRTYEKAFILSINGNCIGGVPNEKAT